MKKEEEKEERDVGGGRVGQKHVRRGGLELRRER